MATGLSWSVGNGSPLLFDRLRLAPAPRSVSGSVPVLFFGDPSNVRIATLAINPSYREYSHPSRQMKTPGRGHFFLFKALWATAARTRALRARSLTLSPSRKSIARHLPPSRPALKSLSGSGRLAPS